MIRSHVGTVVVGIYMEKDSAALENRVVRDVQTFLRHVETSIQKLQKVVVDCLFAFTTKPKMSLLRKHWSRLKNSGKVPCFSPLQT